MPMTITPTMGLMAFDGESEEDDSVFVRSAVGITTCVSVKTSVRTNVDVENCVGVGVGVGVMETGIASFWPG